MHVFDVFANGKVEENEGNNRDRADELDTSEKVI
jgi:hypothetical protein